MQGPYFFSGQTVEADDLNALHTSAADQIKSRSVDFFSKGVIGDISDVYVVNGVNNTINIQPFVALSPDGERIKVHKIIKALALDTRKQDTEHRLSQQGDIPDEFFGWTLGETYDIYVNYVEGYGSVKAHKTTKLFYPTRINQGFEFYAFRVNTDPVKSVDNKENLVRLARIVVNEEGVQIYSTGYIDVSTIAGNRLKTIPTQTKTTNYRPQSESTTLQDHVLCLGSGTPSPTNPHGLSLRDFNADAQSVFDHENKLHSSGIIGDRASITSGLYTLLNHQILPSQTDSIILFNLNNNEILHHNDLHIDYIINSGSVYNQFEILFRSGTSNDGNILPAGTYTFGIDVANKQLVIALTPEDTQISAYVEMHIVDQNGTLIENITTIDQPTYDAGNYYSIASFVFKQTKETTDIQENILSNFTHKTDLRTFGSVGPKDIITVKEYTESGVNETVNYGDYILKVKALQLNDGSILNGKATLPKDYITGFKILYLDNTSIAIGPGSCRDATDSYDMHLTSTIKKRITLQWTPGGTTSTVVGGTQVTDGIATEETIRTLIKEKSLHIFLLGKIGSSTVDVAFDTSYTGQHILNNGAPTMVDFSYIRRIGSIYVDVATDVEMNPNPVLTPFTTYVNGDSIRTFYNTNTVHKLVAASGLMYFPTKIPSGNLYTCHLTYKNITNVVGFHSNFALNTLYYISGTGCLDIPLQDGNLYFDEIPGTSIVTGGIYCMGFTDYRRGLGE